ncbi:hypothetical protein [Pseudomonas sp. HMWF021]|jgi:hypothetical protein|uniref:hypothetical protein n=1 Tax=Pseudomonas sp. HMWF021 TaxID=2056857 RepID=UPI0011B202B0|nr:hypothetical protein [Pseudomonas sp. HMWF021]
MLKLIIRDTHKKSDYFFLALAIGVGGSAGYVVSGFAPVIAVPFTLLAVVFLYSTWRQPKRVQSH